ncbi:MAG TPA: molecular chaperone TorD family protein [Anaerolineales bacterium]
MIIQPSDPEIYHLFARLLEYPQPGMEELMRQLIGKLPPVSPEAADLLTSFQQFVRKVPRFRLEEIYTSTFDLQGAGCPYIGHHIFGATYKRSWFMARLNREYRLWGYSAGNELPDHISVVLGFLALGNKDEFTQTLLEEGLVPAVEKMVDELKPKAENPYYWVLQSLKLVLGGKGNANPQQSAGSDMGEEDHA